MPPLTRLALRLALALRLSLSQTSPIQEQPVSILSSYWTSPNEGLPQIIKILDMKAVWALLLLFLSQADTYIGRHIEPDLGLIKADSRQGYSFTCTMLLPILGPLQAGSSSEPSFDLSKTQLQNSSVAWVQPEGSKKCQKNLEVAQT